MKKVVVIRFLQGVAFLGAIGADLAATAPNLGRPVDLFKSGQIAEGMWAAGLNVLEQWPLTIGLPVGATIAGKIARGFGTPKLVVGPVELAAF